MSENENENFEIDEMKRIQMEIDSVLNPSVEQTETVQTEQSELVQQTETVQAEFVQQTEAVQAELVQQTETVQTELVQAELVQTQQTETVFAETNIVEGETIPAPDQIFYSETIKTEQTAQPIAKKKRQWKTTAAIVVGAVLIFGAVYTASNASGKGVLISTKEAQQTQETTEQPSEKAFKLTEDKVVPAVTKKFDIQGMSDQFVDVIKSVEPAVVEISTTQAVASGFFGEAPTQQDSGSGTGIIFHQDEEKVYVVTNYHVINGANGVNVSITSKEPVAAKHVASDPSADLAVISILKTDLSAIGINEVTLARFGDSDDLQVGEFVIAIGNAFGQGNASTMGIISTKEKEITIAEDLAPLNVIQTSAIINFGNSGGPLINLNGEVIGINTAKVSPEYNAEGMGFAITSNRAKPIIEEFMTSSNRPFLGVSGQTITPEISEMYKLPEAGVFVNAIIEGSCAETAGLKRTDIITSIDNVSMFTVEELVAYIKTCQVGQTINITIIRDGKTPMTISAELRKYDDTSFN